MSLLFLFMWAGIGLHAEDGSRLWLRGDMPKDITLKIDSTMPDDDGYRINGHTVTARTQMGLLYGRYALLRGEQGESHPYFKLRILNHWDNLDGSIERGYAGQSIFWGMENDQFGDDHLLDILRNTHFDSARQVIETLAAEVEHHRGGADPNDDLTMMCLRVS